MLSAPFYQLIRDLPSLGAAWATQNGHSCWDWAVTEWEVLWALNSLALRPRFTAAPFRGWWGVPATPPSEG